MTLLEQLQSHRGGLLHLKTQLYWHDGRGWDNNPGRICLLLDAVTTATTAASQASAAHTESASSSAVALLLIDGSPQWVWVAEQDVEVIDESR